MLKCNLSRLKWLIHITMLILMICLILSLAPMLVFGETNVDQSFADETYSDIPIVQTGIVDPKGSGAEFNIILIQDSEQFIDHYIYVASSRSMADTYCVYLDNLDWFVLGPPGPSYPLAVGSLAVPISPNAWQIRMKIVSSAPGVSRIAFGTCRECTEAYAQGRTLPVCGNSEHIASTVIIGGRRYSVEFSSPKPDSIRLTASPNPCPVGEECLITAHVTSAGVPSVGIPVVFSISDASFLAGPIDLKTPVTTASGNQAIGVKGIKPGSCTITAVVRETNTIETIIITFESTGSNIDVPRSNVIPPEGSVPAKPTPTLDSPGAEFTINVTLKDGNKPAGNLYLGTSRSPADTFYVQVNGSWQALSAPNTVNLDNESRYITATVREVKVKVVSTTPGTSRIGFGDDHQAVTEAAQGRPFGPGLGWFNIIGGQLYSAQFTSPPPSQLVIELPDGGTGKYANGIDFYTIRVRVLTSEGIPVSGYPVNFSILEGIGATLSATSGATNAAGVAEIKVFSERPGVIIIQTSTSSGLKESISVEFLAAPLADYQLTLSASDGGVGKYSYTITALAESNGEGVNGLEISFQVVSMPSGAAPPLSASKVVADANGKAEIQFNGNRDGEYEIRAYTNAGVSATLTILCGSDGQYTISYHANGGTNAPVNQAKSYNIPIILSTIFPTRPSYTFLGWSTDSDAARAQYLPGDPFSLNANTTLYAVWSSTGNLIGGEATSLGVRLWWNPMPGGVGYRVYRSENPSELGISITDFYITSNEFVDVNVKSYTTYYYTVRQVLNEASPLANIAEGLGANSNTVSITTEEILEPEKDKEDQVKKFILMTMNDPFMIINGERKEIDQGRGTTPILLRERTMVPIRAIVEGMGGNAEWQDENREVSLQYRKNTVLMWLDKLDISVNGQSKPIDVAPASINDRTMVPVRFSAENLGCAVDWLNSTQQIVIAYY